MIPYLHIYADGDWKQSVREFLVSLGPDASDLRVGVVGSVKNLLEVKSYLKKLGRVFRPTIVAYHAEGYEQITLEFLHAEAETTDEPFLYAHTKGASSPTDLNIAWRRSMLDTVVRPWPEHLDKLNQYDIIGSRWLRSTMTNRGFFGGNFWIARADYLRTLPELEYKTRYDAETWIGQGAPRVLDLKPGWPAPFNLGA